MANKNTSLEALKTYLFESIEGVKNLNDSVASDNEKTTIEQASAIAQLSGCVIDIYKTQINAVKVFGELGGGKAAKEMADLGIIEEKPKAIVQ